MTVQSSLIHSPRRRNYLPTRVSNYPSQSLLVWRNFLYLKKGTWWFQEEEIIIAASQWYAGGEFRRFGSEMIREKRKKMPGRTTSEEDVLWLFLFYKTAMKKKIVQKTLNIPYKRPTQFHSADKNRFNDPTTSSHSIIKDCHDFSRCLLERRVRKLEYICSTNQNTQSCGISKYVLSFSAKLQCIQTNKSQRLLANNHLANGKLLENLWFKSKISNIIAEKVWCCNGNNVFLLLFKFGFKHLVSKKKTHACYPAQALAHHKGSPNQTGI